MKSTTILCISLLLALGLQAQSKKELKANNIKSITVWQADAKNSKVDGFKESYEEFDKNGRTIVKTEYNKEGTVTKKETNKRIKFILSQVVDVSDTQTIEPSRPPQFWQPCIDGVHPKEFFRDFDSGRSNNSGYRAYAVSRHS